MGPRNPRHVYKIARKELEVTEEECKAKYSEHFITESRKHSWSSRAVHTTARGVRGPGMGAVDGGGKTSLGESATAGSKKGYQVWQDTPLSMGSRPSQRIPGEAWNIACKAWQRFFCLCSEKLSLSVSFLYFPKRYIRARTEYLPGQKPSWREIAGRARLFCTNWSSVSIGEMMHVLFL